MKLKHWPVASATFFVLFGLFHYWKCGCNCGECVAVSMRLSPTDLWTLLWIVLLFNAMGCIQSIRCKPKSFRESVIVLEVNSSIDSNPTSIDESSSVVLRYRTPHFRASARVLVPPVAGKETWTVGWIQACNHMEFYNKYGTKGMWVQPTNLVSYMNEMYQPNEVLV